MKPTENQLKIINFCEWFITSLRDTNDITSPTHFNDLTECIRAELEDILEYEQLEYLEDRLSDILWFIKDHDERWSTVNNL